VHLHRQVGDLAGHLGAEQLRRRRGDAAVLVVQPLRAASRTRARPASTPVCWSASIACTSWKPIGVPPWVADAA
jgi:hypothetical protein